MSGFKKMDARRSGRPGVINCLVLAPTRELATQIQVRRFYFSLCCLYFSLLLSLSFCPSHTHTLSLITLLSLSIYILINQSLFSPFSSIFILSFSSYLYLYCLGTINCLVHSLTQYLCVGRSGEIQ